MLYATNQYEGMIAETTLIPGHNGDLIGAYVARPMGPGPFPAIIVIHHMPGWDEWYREVTRKFAHHGFIAVSPNLYHRAGHGIPEDVAAMVRAAGGVPDDQVVGDVAGMLAFVRALPHCTGKVALFGTCSGARHAYLAAARTPGFAALIDCWGGRVTMEPHELTANQPVAPVDYTAGLECPVLGIFGAEDSSPTPAQVGVLEQALKKHGKTYDFHMYTEAGHGFFYYDRPAYRQTQTMDGWKKIWAFLDQYVRS
jgi:carboxymethylenebutenolidase